MSNAQIFEQKGKVRQKPTAETETAHINTPPLTLARIQGRLDADAVTQMQQTLGNAAVQRVLAQRSADGGGELDDALADQINSRRGQGQTLDPGMAGRAGSVMGADLSQVQVHTDGTADQLSRAIGAKAFTTGSDVFFRSGAYNPSSGEGQHLIAHELTHVVQQGASAPAVQGKMTVNDPNDQYETEADAVADTVMSHPEEGALLREALPEEEEEVQMQEMPEDEELQMQEMPEEEEELA